MKKLSYMKIGTKEFILEVGDKFFTNGSCFTYMPIGKKNIKLCKRSDDNYHSSTSIEISKAYRELILSGDCPNLEYVQVMGDNKTWKVTSVDDVKIKEPEFGELWYIGIGIDTRYSSSSNRTEMFNVETAKIKSRTPKQINLVKDLNYRSMYNTNELLDKILSKHVWGSDRLMSGDDFCVFIEIPEEATPEKFEKLEEWKNKLYESMKNKLEAQLNKAQNNLAKLSTLSTNAGF